MKHIKMISAIIIAAILCAGCAETKDESSVPEVTTTAATTTEATTTAATTTTVTEATTTVSTEETEEEVKPDTETSDNDNTPALGTTQDKPEIEEPQPEVSTTPDGKYTLADTDLVNPDGTYTQNEFNPDTVPTWSSSDPDKNWSRMSGKYTSSPSLIPYSEITLENAAEAFPFLGYIGYIPDYYMVLSTDSSEVIARKVYYNLVGKKPDGYEFNMSGYYNFTSEADYNAYLAEQEQQAEENRLLGEQAQAEQDAAHRGEGPSIGDGGTGEGLYDYLTSLQN